MQWNPEDYAKNSGAQLGWARELIKRLHLTGQETLLDVGCGDGKITAELARSLPEGFVLGVDSSPDFVEYARRHYPATEYPNLVFETMDARSLTYPREFDLVFSNAVLHWVDDHRAFLAGCAKLLKPQGRLIISCGGQGNAAGMVAALNQVTALPAWTPYFTDFTFPFSFYAPVDYGAWLPEMGFQPGRAELVEKDMVHSGREGLAGWIRTTWFPYLQQLPEAQREAFLEECLATYLHQSPLDDEGNSHVRMVRLEVEARRI